MRKYYSAFFAALLVVLSGACSFFEVEDVIDPNNASLESVLVNASPAQINQLAVGVQSALRSGLFDQYYISGTVGREIIVSASTDNRYFTELLGVGRDQFEGANDPVGIFNNYYIFQSQTRRRAEVFLLSAENTHALTEQQKQAARGFANTMKALVMLNILNMQGENGIRSTFTDLLSPGDMLKPGPFTTYASGLNLVKTIIDDAKTQLQAGGGTFPFPLTSGFTGFNTPASFLTFNRAIAARVNMYLKDWSSMNAALAESFLNTGGSLTTGPVFTFSTTAGDIVNPFYQNKNTTGRPIVVFNEFILEAEPGDTRVFGATSKVSQRTSARSSLGVPDPSTHEVFMFATNAASAPIVKNEELILMRAEGQININDLAGAQATLDIIRTAYGLPTIAVAKPGIVGN